MVKKRLEHAREGKYSKSNIRGERKLALAMFVAGPLLAVLFTGLSFPSLPVILSGLIQLILIGMSLALCWTGVSLRVATGQLDTILS